jgi:hypothetical protein
MIINVTYEHEIKIYPMPENIDGVRNLKIKKFQNGVFRVLYFGEKDGKSANGSLTTTRLELHFNDLNDFFILVDAETRDFLHYFWQSDTNENYINYLVKHSATLPGIE